MDFDFQTFQQITQGTVQASGAMDSVLRMARGFKDLVKSPKGASEAEIESAIEKLALAVENAKLQNDLLKTQVTVAENELRRAQAAQAKLEAYEVRSTPGGAVVYGLKDPDHLPYGRHLACPYCYEDERLSILQGDDFEKTCHRCKAAFTVGIDHGGGNKTTAYI